VGSLCLSTDRCLWVPLYSGQYRLEQGQGYRVRKQYDVIGIRAGYSNTAWISFITTNDQGAGLHFPKLAMVGCGLIFDPIGRRSSTTSTPLFLYWTWVAWASQPQICEAFGSIGNHAEIF